MRRRLSKSTGDVCDLSKSTSIRKKINAYRPSNRYSDKHVNTFLKSSENNGEVWNVDDATNSLCTSCAQNLAAMQCKELFTKDRNKMNDEVYETQDKTNDDRYNVFLKVITSFDNVRKTCIRREIGEINTKILHLMGPSPRSLYVRQNVTGLITYKHYREKECKMKTISNETKHITFTKRNNSIIINEEKKKKKGSEHTELIFDIVTKDMQKMQLHSTQLKDPHYILSCLEKYLGIQSN